MPDPRVTGLAQVLVRYSLALRPGDEFCLVGSPLGDELNLAVYKEAVQAGAVDKLLVLTQTHVGLLRRRMGGIDCVTPP